MLKFFFCVQFILCFLFADAKHIHIRYQAAGASSATLIWGLDNWGYAEERPAGTVIKDKVMHTPMTRSGAHFMVDLNVPDSSTIDYVFQFEKKMGPFGVRFDYLDINEQPGQKYYHTVVKDSDFVSINPNLDKVSLLTQFSVLTYSFAFFAAFSLAALIFYVTKKVRLSKMSPLRGESLFFAIPLSLLCMLVISRALVTGIAVQFLTSPMHALPLLFKTSFQDFLYVVILSLIFAPFYFAGKSRPKTLFYIFGAFALLSIAIGMINIQVTALLGRPFNYQWLYYSDFLQSSDASRAIGSNLESKPLAALFLMMLAAIPLLALLYHALSKKPVWVILLVTGCVSLGYFATGEQAIAPQKTKNPVFYFVRSLFQGDGMSILSAKKDNEQPAFLTNNKNIVEARYSQAFSKAKVKNVVVLVLESTPAEYVTVYNPKYETMPFLNSIRSSALIFDEVYAHAPATNKSMASLLCSVYPYLSYKSVTAERPDIDWPSLPSELNKAGYRTAFFNSGDNRFQGAENFLRNRGFGRIEDYRQNTCAVPTFSDRRYANENLEGINDSCLPVKLFNWLGEAPGKPFFSMLWTYQTHYPYYASGNRKDFHVNNESQDKYLNALSSADNALKEIVAGLEKRDLLKSTLIVIVGDHGEAFGRHGQITHAGGIYEENLHIPLILINPLLFEGKHVPVVGGISDVAPTIFSVIGQPIPAAWQGENLFSTQRRDQVYFFSPYSDYLFGCRQGNFKYIYNASTDVSALYDLDSDPGEATNIAGEHPEKLREMNANLHAWMRYQADFMAEALRKTKNVALQTR